MKITPRTERAILPGRNRTATTPKSEPLPVPPPSSVTPEISEKAREKVLTATGKNAASPAQRARATLADYEKLGHLRFGRLVSALARGETTESTEPVDETPPVTATAPTDTAPTPTVTETSDSADETPTG